jgi:hypothetical protein
VYNFFLSYDKSAEEAGIAMLCIGPTCIRDIRVRMQADLTDCTV